MGKVFSCGILSCRTEHLGFAGKRLKSKVVFLVLLVV
jgi:hypothetical protein